MVRRWLPSIHRSLVWLHLIHDRRLFRGGHDQGRCHCQHPMERTRKKAPHPGNCTGRLLQIRAKSATASPLAPLPSGRQLPLEDRQQLDNTYGFLVSYAALAQPRDPPPPIVVDGSELQAGFTYVVAVFCSEADGGGEPFQYSLVFFVPGAPSSLLQPYMVRSGCVGLGTAAGLQPWPGCLAGCFAHRVTMPFSAVLTLSLSGASTLFGSKNLWCLCGMVL